MSNLLGENFKPYVANQIKTRQSILGRRETGILSDENSNNAIVWENAKTAYVALASSIDILDTPIFDTKINVSVDVRTGTQATSDEEAEDLRENAGFPDPVPGTEDEPQPTEPNNFEVVFVPALTPEQANEIATQIARGVLGAFTQTDRIDNLFYRKENTDKNIITLQRYNQVVDAFKTLFGREWKAGFGGVPREVFPEVSRFARNNQDPIDNGNLETAIIKEAAYNEDDLANLKARLYDDTEYAFLASPPSSPLKLTLNGEEFTSPYSGQVTYYVKAKEGQSATFEELQTQQAIAVRDATYVAPSPDELVVQQLESQITTVTTVETELIDTGRTDGLGTKRVKEGLELEGDPSQYLGNFVSRNLVLTNGTTFISQDGNRIQKAGVANTLSTFNSFVYGFGGDQEFGLTAMPGLEGVDVKSKNMGSLREATVTLRANSEKQFSLIDTIYCRIGYTMFLEWGNSVYFDNNKHFVSDPLIEGVPSLIPTFLKPTDTDTCTNPEQGIQQQIEENRRLSCGNYDALDRKSVV